jgi:hypothetical protein
MSSLIRDLHHAARALPRSRGFGALAVLAAAAGIGANVVIFLAVRALLPHPLPHAEAGRPVERRVAPPASPADLAGGFYAPVLERARTLAGADQPRVSLLPPLRALGRSGPETVDCPARAAGRARA